MKVCKKCNISKDETEFCKNVKNADNLNNYCRQCVKAKQGEYTKQGRCRRCGRQIINTTKKTCENCRTIFGYNFTLIKKEELPQKAGNYVLYSYNDKSVYIGATCNLRSRINRHLCDLVKKKHKNKHLQQIFNVNNNLLIYVNICDEQLIYKNEENIFRILEEKGFKILNILPIIKNKILKISQKRTEVILSKIQKQENGCWHYKSQMDKDGYHIIQIDCQQFAVHRVIYTLNQRKKLNDPSWNIPNNLLVRHICHNKRCCNPDHLELGTDKDNAMDNKGKERKPRPYRGELITAWGETKPFGAWMKDSRKSPDLCANTLRSRLVNMEPEKAISSPLFHKTYNKEERAERRKKREEKQQKNYEKFALASLIRKLYEEGECIYDLCSYFTSLNKVKIQRIINCLQWYNPSIPPKECPSDYNRKRRRFPPKNITKDVYGLYVDDKYGIPWVDGYFYEYIHVLRPKITKIGPCETAYEVAKKVNEFYVTNNMPAKYDLNK